MISNKILKQLFLPGISPMVFVTMGLSMFIGFCFFTGLFLSDTAQFQSVLYSSGVLVERHLWGGMLFVAASLAQTGFFTGKDALIKVGTFVGFLLWFFATVSVGLAGHWYIFFTVAGFNLVFHIYVFLATSLNLLRRMAVEINT